MRKIYRHVSAFEHHARGSRPLTWLTAFMTTRHNSTVRVGLIGYGLAGSAFHAPLIATTPGMTLAAIVTGNPERIADAHAAHPEAQIMSKSDELWELPDLDVVVIATPNTSHAPLANEAIVRGIAVVVDKPLAISYAEAAAVITAAERAGVLLTVFQNRRWDGDFLTVKSLAAQRAFGRVTRFESRFERWRPQIKAGWRENVPPSEGGGLLFDLGAHVIDQALNLWGPATCVYAEVDTNRASAKVDDDVFVAITHESGIRSHLFASATAADLGPKFRVLGTKGGYSCYGLDVQEAALRSGQRPSNGWGAVDPENWGEYTNLAGETSPYPTIPGDYPAFYRKLEAAIRDGGPAPVNPHDAAETLKIIAAARESSDQRQVINL